MLETLLHSGGYARFSTERTKYSQKMYTKLIIGYKSVLVAFQANKMNSRLVFYDPGLT